MLIVHEKQSMPDLLMNKRRGVPPDVLLDQLQVKTSGDWQGVSKDAIKMYGDYIAGAYQGRIVSVYKIEDHTVDSMPAPFTRTTFEVSQAPEMEFMIGQPCPGGPWKRGESRPVRYAFTEDVLEFYRDEVGLTEEEMAAGGQGGDIEDAMLANLESFQRPPKTLENVAGGPLDQVDLTVNPRGGIIVTVPAGTRVLVVPRPG